MKVALIAGGQPRFTDCFKILMDQLTGFDSADLYFSFWKTDWAEDEVMAEKKVNKILNHNYTLKKIQICDQPILDLPPHRLNHAPPSPENIRWWFLRRSGMWQSLRMAYNLIDEHYDLVIRCRVDGMLDKSIDLRSFNYGNLILPSWPRHGFANRLINDQFAIGNLQTIDLYTKLGDEYCKYVVKSDPCWEENGHGTWAGEHVLATYLEDINQKYILGDFKSLITGAAGCPIMGRSKYTDRHFHHSVLPDPTN